MYEHVTLGHIYLEKRMTLRKFAILLETSKVSVMKNRLGWCWDNGAFSKSICSDEIVRDRPQRGSLARLPQVVLKPQRFFKYLWMDCDGILKWLHHFSLRIGTPIVCMVWKVGLDEIVYWGFIQSWGWIRIDRKTAEGTTRMKITL